MPNERHRYTILPQAEADLDAHARAIASDNLDAGLRLYDRAEETYQMLSGMPHMGTLHQTIKPALMGIRYVPIKAFPRYLVFYQPTDETVAIIRVLHVRMDKDGWL